MPNANAQCTVMVTDPAVDLTISGSTATLDSAAVAANISTGGTGTCVGYTFFDEFDNPLGASVTVNCDGTMPGAGTYFLVIADGTPDASNKVQLTVSLTDNTDPSFTVPADVTISCEDDETDLTLTGDVTDEMDNCAMMIQATYMDDQSTLTGCNGTGTFVRTWTLSDGNGNSVSQDQNITIQDVTVPTFTVPADVTIDFCDDSPTDLTITGDVTDEADNCSTMLEATYTDGPVTAGPNTNSGSFTRTWTLVDSCNNATNFMQTIVMIDSKAPVATLMDTTVNSDSAACNAMITLALDTMNTSDNCDAFSDLTITHTSSVSTGGADASGTYPTGTTTVTFTIEDQYGNTTMHEVDVTVNDINLPTIVSCPADITLNADANDCDNTYSWSAPYATAFCGGASVTGSVFSDDPNVLVNLGAGVPGPAPTGRVDFADFPVGITNIGYAFTDANGNQDTCLFTVTILDTQAPAITCPTDQTYSYGSCTPAASLLVPDYTGLGAVADNCASGYTVTQIPAANSLLSAATTIADGATFTVSLIATDNNANNLADTCMFNVTLMDTNTPIADVAGSILPTETSTCGPLVLCAPTATDNCGNLIPGTLIPATPAGVTVVGTCSAPCTPNPTISLAPGLAIPDAGSIGFPIPVSLTDPTVDQVEISLQIDHTWVGDLSATLISPSGTPVQLFETPGSLSSSFGCEENNLNVTFSDDATNDAVAFEDACNGSDSSSHITSTAISGIYQPIGDLSDFSGEPVNGTWTLLLSDANNFDTGSLEGVSIDFCTLSGATIPEYEFTAGTYNLTWEYDDGNGNTSQQTQTVIVSEDTELPVINCADITVELDENGNANVSAGDLTAESISLTSGGNLSFSPGNADFCVNITSATTISFAWDYSSADISALWDPFGYTLNGVFTPLATSNLTSDAASTQQSGVTSVSLSPGDVFCFRQNTVDNIPPNAGATITGFVPGFTGDFAPANWSEVLANSSGSATYNTPDITDNCDVDFSTLAINGVNIINLTCADVGTFTANITVDDINGNTGTCTANITVEDNTAPTLTGVPADNTISCGDNLSAPVVTANDVCDGALSVTFNQMSTKTGNPATCGDYNYTLTRTWSATDNSGNAVSESMVLTVEDTEAPTDPVYSDNLGTGVLGTDPINCSANVTLELVGLSDCAPFANITVTNNSPYATSGGADASGVYPEGPHNVNFIVTDPCGNTTSYNRNFIVQDTDGPVAICNGTLTIGLPTNGSLTLLPSIVDNGSIDNCGSIDTMYVTPNTFDCEDAYTGNPHMVTLTVIDDAGNQSTCTSMVTIQDNDAPVMSCQDITINLDDTGNASITPADVDNGSFDNCTALADLVYNVSPSTFDVSDLGTTVQVDLSVTDRAGNTSTCPANVTVEIPQPCIKIETGIGATGTVVSVPVTVTDFNNVLSFQFSATMGTGTTGEFLGISSNILPPNTFDNVISTDTISISWVSGVIPAELTLPDSTAIFNIDILLTGGVGTTSVVSIIDDINSLPLELVYNYGAGPNSLRPCTSPPGAVAVNAPASLTVAGQILDENGGASAKVNVDLINLANPGTPMMSIPSTTAPGDYSFNPVNAGLSVRIEPSKSTSWTHGVTANDIFEIQKHIVGLDTLDSNYKKVAADVRRDGEITGFDVVDIQILLGSLGSITPPTNTSWRFAAVKDTLADLPPLFVPGITSTLTINNLSRDSLSNDFVIIKTGDVTGNAVATTFTNNGNAFSRSSEAVKIIIEDQLVKAGEDISLDITAQNFTDLVAYQWVLNFNPEVLSFNGYDKGALDGLGDYNFGQYHLDKGLLPLLWHQVKAANYEADEVLFTLNFKALQDAASLKELLRIDEVALQSGAWKEAGLPQPITLEFTKSVKDGFSLMQNQPNPFKTETVIGFYLPQDEFATLQILDVSGRLIKQIQGDYSKGYNEVSISRSELSAAGVLYYRLETTDEVATKKMIIVE